MKKWVSFASALFLLSTQAMSKDVNRDIVLFYQVSYECRIDLANNNLQGNIELGKPTSSVIVFYCAELNGAEVLLSSLGGGLKKGEDQSQIIHYKAQITADHLTAKPLMLNTQTDGTNLVSAKFSSPESIASVTGKLEVTLQTPEDYVPDPGQYEDTLRVTLKAPLSAAS